MIELLAIQNQNIAQLEMTTQTAFIQVSGYGRPSGSYAGPALASAVGAMDQALHISIGDSASDFASLFDVEMSVPKLQRSVTSEEDEALWLAMESSTTLVSRGRLAV